MPFPFDGIVLGVNYTLVRSQARYPYFDVTGARGVVTKYTDSKRSGRLVYQPNDIVNAYLGYDYKGFSARVSCIYQGSAPSYIGAYAEADGYTQNYFRIDLSARQKLPWEGVEIYMDANNLNNESNISAQQSIDGFTNQQFYGLTADLGLRITL